MFKNAKLSTKLIGGFGIVLTLLVVVMGIYQFSALSTNNGFKGLMQTEIEITNRAANAEILMLQSRRNEKDFLLRLDKKYEDRIIKTVAGLKKEAQAIAELAGESENKEMADQALSIVKYADHYAKAFAGIVAAWERKGLDQEKGLRGKFRNAAHTLAEDIPSHAVDDLRIAMLQMRRYEKDYLRTKSDKYKQKFTAAIDTYGSLLEKSQCDQTAKASQQAALASYRKAFNDYVTAEESSNQQDQAYQTMRTAAHQMEAALDSVNVHETKALLLDIRKYEKDYLLRGDEKYVKKTHDAIEKMIGAFRGAGILQAHVVDTEKLLKNYQAAFDSLVAEDGKIVALTASMRDAVHMIEPVVENLAQTAKTAAAAKSQGTIDTANRNAKIALAVGIGAVILGLCLAFFIMRSITKPINLIINDLNNGSEQVASASGQISSASQQLAEGSSEQAASIEETSSSLEEMSSMTKQNADNASQADNLMKDANHVVEQANQSMDELTVSMEEISKASAETSKIIKTIDEIAFQTNLLALNAAVEAARAGEAGAGFAVVADEVRNLAMRAAEAAKSTSDLIEGTVKKINDGSALVTRTNDAFTQVAGSAAKVGDLVGEIAAASNEQAQGIEQVNTAVTEMDQVTQATASNAEETASASEELSAQAEQMKSVVARLVSLVGSQKNTTQRQSASTAEVSNFKASKSLNHNASPGKEKRTLPRGPEESPEQVIPMDDEVFKDF